MLQAHNLEAVWNHHTLLLLELGGDALADLNSLQGFHASFGLLWHHPATHKTVQSHQLTAYCLIRNIVQAVQWLSLHFLWILAANVQQPQPAQATSAENIPANRPEENL